MYTLDEIFNICDIAKKYFFSLNLIDTEKVYLVL